MINEKVTQALSDQVNAEIHSAYLYLAMSARAARMGFKGFVHWLYVQLQEEMEHGLHMHQYILQKLQYIKDNVSMILALDAELGARIFVNPFANAAA